MGATRNISSTTSPPPLSVYAEVATLDDLRATRTKASLQAQGIIGRPVAPLLVIGGVHDTQVPIADIDLLLHTTARRPKEAWINPAGGRMGCEGWTDPVIFKRITMPWAAARAEGGVGPSAPAASRPPLPLRLAAIISNPVMVAAEARASPCSMR